jgi:hypothetical protein
VHPFLAYTKKTTIKKAKTRRNKRKKEASPQRFSIVKATASYMLFKTITVTDKADNKKTVKVTIK